METLDHSVSSQTCMNRTCVHVPVHWKRRRNSTVVDEGGFNEVYPTATLAAQLSEVTTHVRRGNQPAAAPADGRRCPKYLTVDGNGGREPRGSGGGDVLRPGPVATAIDTTHASFSRFNLCGWRLLAFLTCVISASIAPPPFLALPPLVPAPFGSRTPRGRASAPVATAAIQPGIKDARSRLLLLQNAILVARGIGPTTSLL